MALRAAAFSPRVAVAVDDDVRGLRRDILSGNGASDVAAANAQLHRGLQSCTDVVPFDTGGDHVMLGALGGSWRSCSWD